VEGVTSDVHKAEIELIKAVDRAAYGGIPMPTYIHNAYSALVFACPECAAGGHTCPGDGSSIPHGATDCGQHDDKPQHAGADGSCPDYGSTLDPCPPGCASGTCVVNTCRCSRTEKQYCHLSDCHGGADVPQWHERTWVDVRTGDTVKLPGTENTAYVRHAVHQGWHVDPRSSEYRPVAMEWSCVHVELTAGQEHDAATLGVLDMDPAKPILIQLSRSEVDAIELLDGWQQRVGMIMTEAPKP
jgi:hypothetical protein